ncbi:HNH endonuclease [Listeria booriae]|nr:HNH endonuclease [Listeria booriae]
MVQPMKRIIRNGKRILVPAIEKVVDHKGYDKQRMRNEPDRIKFYKSAGWKKTRELKLISDPLCEKCSTPDNPVLAEMVDHMIETNTSEGWERRLDEEHLQSLCWSCHNKKTFSK